jgi:heme-degrading monooxygenase HmoA
MSTPVYRVDMFAVPPASLPVFLERVRRIDQLLARQPGCLQNLVLTRIDGPGEFGVATIVEWADAAAMAQARATIQAHQAESGFDPAEFMNRLGVRSDTSAYRAA